MMIFNNRLSILSWLHDAEGLTMDGLSAQDRTAELPIRQAAFNVAHHLIASVGNYASGLEEETACEEAVMAGIQDALENYRESYGVTAEAVEKVPEGATLQ